MGRFIAAAIALAAVSTSLQRRAKACKGPDLSICYRQGPTVDVPPQPTFLVYRDSLDRGTFQVTDRWRHAQSSEPRLGPPQTFSYTVDVVDEQFARVTIDASDGDVFTDPGSLGGGCPQKRYRVDGSWKPTREPPTIRAEPIAEILSLSVETATSPSWTQVEWAYVQDDIDAGRAGASRWEGDYQHILDADLDVHRIYLKIRQVLPDKSEQTWRGWIEKTRRGYRFHPGLDPGAKKPALLPSKCSAAQKALHPTPVNPTLVTGFRGSPRFLATTTDGAPLPTRVTRSDRGYPALVTVEAAAGTRFYLQELPLSRSCQDLVPRIATTTRSMDRTLAVNGLRGAVLEFQNAEPEHRWLHVQWSVDPSFADADADATRGSYLSAEDKPTPFQRDKERFHADHTLAIPRGLAHFIAFRFAYIKVTPRWSSGHEGRPWTGWIYKNGNGFELGSIAEPIPPPVRSVLRP